MSKVVESVIAATEKPVKEISHSQRRPGRLVRFGDHLKREMAAVISCCCLP